MIASVLAGLGALALMSNPRRRRRARRRNPRAIPNAVKVQEEAVAAILRARPLSKRAMGHGHTVLNRGARVIGGIRKRLERELAKCGYTEAQTKVAWEDVKDVAKLEAGAYEDNPRGPRKYADYEYKRKGFKVRIMKDWKAPWPWGYWIFKGENVIYRSAGDGDTTFATKREAKADAFGEIDRGGPNLGKSNPRRRRNPKIVYRRRGYSKTLGHIGYLVPFKDGVPQSDYHLRKYGPTEVEVEYSSGNSYATQRFGSFAAAKDWIARKLA